MLCADVVVAEAARLVHSELKHLLGARGQAGRRIADCRALSAADDELDRIAHAVEIDAHIGQNARTDTLALTHQADQNMLSADVVVVETLRFLLGQPQNAPGTLGEAIKLRHAVPPGTDIARTQLGSIG